MDTLIRCDVVNDTVGRARMVKCGVALWRIEKWRVFLRILVIFSFFVRRDPCRSVYNGVVIRCAKRM